MRTYHKINNHDSFVIFYTPTCFSVFRNTYLYEFLFAMTAAGVVPCGGPKKSPRTASIVQIIFSFWSFENSEGILRNQKKIFGLDSFSNKRLIYLAPFGLY